MPFTTSTASRTSLPTKTIPKLVASCTTWRSCSASGTVTAASAPAITSRTVIAVASPRRLRKGFGAGDHTPGGGGGGGGGGAPHVGPDDGSTIGAAYGRSGPAPAMSFDRAT